MEIETYGKVKKYPNPNPNGKPLIDCKGCRQRKEHSSKGYCYACYKKFIWKPKEIECESCGRIRPHKAFGLCGGCHTRLYHYDLTKSYNAKKLHNIGLDKLRQITKACASCDFDKLVTLHHLDGNRKNNDDENLIGLCHNCHKMVHTYKYFEEVKGNLRAHGFNVEKIHPTSYVKR